MDATNRNYICPYWKLSWWHSRQFFSSEPSRHSSYPLQRSDSLMQMPFEQRNWSSSHSEVGAYVFVMKINQVNNRITWYYELWWLTLPEIAVQLSSSEPSVQSTNPSQTVFLLMQRLWSWHSNSSSVQRISVRNDKMSRSTFTQINIFPIYKWISGR